jgi:hypothetical protein
MATKKNSVKPVPEKSLLNKIAGEVGHIAGNIAVGKDHLIKIAGHAIDSVKETLHITTKKKAVPKKAVKAVKKAVSKRPIAKKAAKPATSKKATSVKKVIKKVAKKK